MMNAINKFCAFDILLMLFVLQIGGLVSSTNKPVSMQKHYISIYLNSPACFIFSLKRTLSPMVLIPSLESSTSVRFLQDSMLSIFSYTKFWNKRLSERSSKICLKISAILLANALGVPL